LAFILEGKLFQKSFENVFECVRKEKGKKKRNFFLSFGPEAQLFRALLFSFGPAAPCSLFRPWAVLRAGPGS
jgi:hypothetical protein